MMNKKELRLEEMEQVNGGLKVPVWERADIPDFPEIAGTQKTCVILD